MGTLDHQAANLVSLDERRQRLWELERADDTARLLIQRLEMADRPADVAIVRELRMRLSVDRRAAGGER